MPSAFKSTKIIQLIWETSGFNTIFWVAPSLTLRQTFSIEKCAHFEAHCFFCFIFSPKSQYVTKILCALAIGIPDLESQLTVALGKLLNLFISVFPSSVNLD